MSWRREETRKSVLDSLKEGAEVFAFDTETSGLSEKKDRIVEFAGIRYLVQNGCLVPQKQFNTYIRLPDNIVMDEKAFAAHGLSRAFLSDKPEETDIIDDVFAFFRGDAPKIISGYNSGFDIRFVGEMYKRNGLDFCPCVNLDVLEMARDRVSKAECKSHKLGDIAHFFGLDENVSFHNALDDIMITGKLLSVFWKEYQEETLPDKATLRLPTIKGVSFWEGHQGFSRIYVNTSEGEFYYDIRRKTWEEKEIGTMKNVNMEHVVTEAMKAIGATSEKEFTNFKGKVFIN